MTADVPEGEVAGVVKQPTPEAGGFGASLISLPLPRRSDSEGLEMIHNTVDASEHL
jgi:hypothetical protein